jgi:hypothetical protein
VRRQPAIAGLWGIIIALSLAGVVSMLAGSAQALLVVLALVWLAAVLLFFKRQSQRRDAEERQSQLRLTEEQQSRIRDASRRTERFINVGARIGALTRRFLIVAVLIGALIGALTEGTLQRVVLRVVWIVGLALVLPELTALFLERLLIGLTALSRFLKRYLGFWWPVLRGALVGAVLSLLFLGTLLPKSPRMKASPLAWAWWENLPSEVIAAALLAGAAAGSVYGGASAAFHTWGIMGLSILYYCLQARSFDDLTLPSLGLPFAILALVALVVVLLGPCGRGEPGRRRRGRLSRGSTLSSW